jgi:hypothetical protein
MKKHLLVATLLALHGCATEIPPPAPSGPSVRPPDVTPIEATGPYTHEPSHAVIPAEVGSFRRVSLFRRGADGQRLTAGYAGGTPQCLVAITLFLDPAEETGSVDKVYARAKADVMEAFPSARFEREESRSTPDTPGRRALFLIDERRLEVGVSQARTWDVKHRAIFPAKCSEEAGKYLSEFFPGWGH